MANKLTAPCRLFGILARAAPVAVLFRRGPSHWVQLIKWNTKTDVFEHGQWFKGRIYERRCDLSPDGSMLIYFASKINRKTVKDLEYTYAWTAISRPPWVTALALWPKGDCWHGGGLFEDEKTVWLNHKPEVAEPHSKHQPRGLKIIPNPHANGEDQSIYSKRLLRDKWMLTQERNFNLGAGGGWRTEHAEIWSKADASGQFILNMNLDKIDFSAYGGPYLLRFDVIRKQDGHQMSIGRATWADWDHRGRLVIARAGKLLLGSVGKNSKVSFVELADFNSAKPVEVQSPTWAQEW